MDVVKTLSPGSPGTKRFTEKYGERLVCVRYRVDKARKQRLTTIEVIVSRKDDPGGYYPDLSEPHPNRVVHLRIDYAEHQLRESVKHEGGQWDPKTRLWRLRRHKAARLGLQDRIVTDEELKTRQI